MRRNPCGFQVFTTQQSGKYTPSEVPQLVTGDTTIIQQGMVLAVDGSVSVDTFRAQVGDSFIITQDGYEPITNHPKSIEEVFI